MSRKPSPKLSRHAKNKARRLGVAREAVTNAIRSFEPVSADDDGNPKFVWTDEGGITLIAVVARDDPEVVITIWRV